MALRTQSHTGWVVRLPAGFVLTLDVGETRIKHSGYFVSVYGKTAADYTLMAYTHYGPVNPRQQYHDGDHQIRRKSLQPSWDAGQLTVSLMPNDALISDFLRTRCPGVLMAPQPMTSFSFL